MLVPTVNDVVFSFTTRAKDSATGVVARELWASRSELLAHEYWRALFDSGCVETDAAGRFEPAETPRAVADERAGETIDSDDEIDAILPVPAKSSVARPAAHVIFVTDAAYSTYRAMLLFLVTGSIKFAPLSSRGEQARSQAIDEALLEHPGMPPPVSPLAVYRLEDKLDLPVL